VEVVLHECAAVVADGQIVASLVFDLDGVAVVDAVGDVLVVRDAECPGLQAGLHFARAVLVPPLAPEDLAADVHQAISTAGNRVTSRP
jgi:hypothetical protein